MLMTKKVYIIILNWNGWCDTIECLESVLKLNYPDFTVVVCDNGSANGSVDKIKAWAQGEQLAGLGQDELVKNKVLPYVKKPLPFVEINSSNLTQAVHTHTAKLIILRSEENLGFAGGNNLGLQYAMQQDDCNYIWLLNNDTVVDQEALQELVKCADQDTKVICGSKILYYFEPERIQALGNSFNKFFGTSKFVTEEADLSAIDFLVGASLLIPKDIFIDTGLLSEDYFLYYEEADLWQKVKGKCKFACALKSLVYHKEGAAVGANNRNKGCKSLLGDFYGIRSRLLFMKKYFPFYLPTVYLGLLFTIFNRFRRHQYDRVKMVIQLMLRPSLTFDEYLHKKN